MTMARHQFSVQDAAGNVVPGAHVEVRAEISGQPLAQLYGDRAGTSALGNPIDADADGFVYFYVAGGSYQIRVYTGPSGAPTFEAPLWRYVAIGLSAETDDVGVKTQRTVTAAGTVTLSDDDVDQINIKKASGAATRVVLPSSSDRIPKRSIRIVDRKYDAATNNITIVPERSSTVTISIASPGVVSLSAHGRSANDPVSLETTGALPTGLLADTQYYVKTVLGAGTFTLSETPGGAAINTTGSQSGVHTMGTDTIMGGASYVIDSNGGSLEVAPLDDGTGWV